MVAFPLRKLFWRQNAASPLRGRFERFRFLLYPSPTVADGSNASKPSRAAKTADCVAAYSERTRLNRPQQGDWLLPLAPRKKTGLRRVLRHSPVIHNALNHIESALRRFETAKPFPICFRPLSACRRPCAPQRRSPSIRRNRPNSHAGCRHGYRTCRCATNGAPPKQPTQQQARAPLR